MRLLVIERNQAMRMENGPYFLTSNAFTVATFLEFVRAFSKRKPKIFIDRWLLVTSTLKCFISAQSRGWGDGSVGKVPVLQTRPEIALQNAGKESDVVMRDCN